MSALPTRVLISRRQLPTNMIDQESGSGGLERPCLMDMRNRRWVVNRCLNTTAWLKHNVESFQRLRSAPGKQAMLYHWELGAGFL